MKGMRASIRLSAAFLACSAWAMHASENPVAKVVLFLEELQTEITEDMNKENQSFTAFQQWCRETTESATANIAEGKKTIQSCNTMIEEISGISASSGAEAEHAEKTLQDNKERMAEAAKMRETEEKEFSAEKAELEDSVAALGKALERLSNKEDTESGSAFLQQNRATSTRVIRELLRYSIISQKMEQEDLKALTDFAAMGEQKSNKGQGFLQLDRDEAEDSGINDDFDSTSGEVVGIIKTTKDDFDKDLNELVEEEGRKVKVYAELSATLTKERQELEEFLTEQKSKNGDAVSLLSEKVTLRDETEISLKADQKLLDSTETTCDEKAYQFAQRKKLRKEELKGVAQALKILSSDNATATFEASAAVSFAQLRKSKQRVSTRDADKRKKAYAILQAAASKTNDLMLAQMALQVQATGYFDKVIDKIDAQITRLRAQEKQDVTDRDRCKKQLADGAAQIADFTSQIQKADTKLDRMNSTKAEMEAQLQELETSINKTKQDIADRMAEREEERNDHLEALKHDTDALELVKSATEQLVAFFEKNDIDVGQEKSLLQRADPEKNGYEQMPDAGFEDGKYEGAKGTTKGAVQIMEMIKEDLESEIKSGKADDAENQQLFEKDYKVMKELLDSQEMSLISTSKALANNLADIEDKKEFKFSKQEEKAIEQTRREKLKSDCAWVENNFQSRRDKRKQEIESLVEAKGLLAGAEPIV
eukprot:TRINITY_DN108683_c0_g1_i1.p1 TRINITY_DN108683_c0_g1~~TRINITY_DN108683_c0_g1_i1.p1  ORF type:complete len:711 (+),score=237.85 TRINITY_DN108683_c0_g1_i1:95-2227(+)